MTLLVAGMIVTGLVTLLAGLLLVRPRFATAQGPGRAIVLGPVFEAVALAIFAAEHFLDARDLAGIVPSWLPGAMFWTYFVGVALLAAALSLIAWRCVRWSAFFLAVLFLIIVITVDLPNLHTQFHDRFFWILTARETCFAAGALVLAGSQWPGATGTWMMRVGRTIVACVFVFYAVQHFLYAHNVPGVPLEKITPAWFPAPVVLANFIGILLLLSGVRLMIPRMQQGAAALMGMTLVVLTALFYVPILIMEVHTPAAVEGVNYVGDTLLFAATALLAGFGAEQNAATTLAANKPAANHSA